MSQHRHLAPRNPPGDLLGAQGGGQREIAAGQSLPHTHDVGADTGVFNREQPPSTPEAGGDLIKDQQHVVVARQLPQCPDVAGAVEGHPTGTLDHGFHDDRRDLVSVAGQQVREVRQIPRVGRDIEADGWLVREDLGRQHPPPELMHAADRVAHGHRMECVAVIAPAPGHQPNLLRTPRRPPVLDRHLGGDLDGHGAGVREEHVAQRLRRHLHQPGGQPDRRLVGQAAEHHVAHLCRLGMQGGVQSGVRIAVDGGPPGGHSVDQLRPAFDWPR